MWETPCNAISWCTHWPTGMIVESDFNKGGTWAGAVEQLDRLRFVKVFARCELCCERELTHGRIPNRPPTADYIKRILCKYRASKTSNVASRKPPIHKWRHSERSSLARRQAKLAKVVTKTPSDQLFEKVEQLLESINTPTSESDVATYLEVSKAQARDWLKQLVRDGKYKRLKARSL